MNPDDAEKYMDENTIGFVVMFGSTYNGQFEDVVKADKLVGRSALSLSGQASSISLPCHVHRGRFMAGSHLHGIASPGIRQSSYTVVHDVKGPGQAVNQDTVPLEAREALLHETCCKYLPCQLRS